MPADFPRDESCRVSHEGTASGSTPSPSRRWPGAARHADRADGPPGWAPAAAGPAHPRPSLHRRRPADAADRQLHGHWESDLVIGKDGKTAVATLFKRTSRFLISAPLTGRDSRTVASAIIAAVGDLPALVTRSLTWDCGAELARHVVVSGTGLPV